MQIIAICSFLYHSLMHHWRIARWNLFKLKIKVSSSDAKTLMYFLWILTITSGNIHNCIFAIACNVEWNFHFIVVWGFSKNFNLTQSPCNVLEAQIYCMWACLFRLTGISVVFYVRTRGWFFENEESNDGKKTFQTDIKEHLHNSCLNPDGFVGFRRREWTRLLLFLCIPSAMRDRRSSTDRLWRHHSEKFIDILMSHKHFGESERSLLKFLSHIQS